MNFPTSSPFLKSLCLSLALASGMMSVSMADDEVALDDASYSSTQYDYDVPMNSSSVNTPSADVRLIRTSATPSEVTVNMPMNMANTVCVDYDQVPVSGYDGARCGYDYRQRRVCVNTSSGGGYDPRGPRDHRGPRGGNNNGGYGHGNGQGRDCHIETVTEARFCTWLETRCVRTEVVNTTASKNVKLKFKNVASLRGGETEIYQLRGQQKRLDASEAVFSLSAISTKRSVKIKAKDGILTGFSDVITIKGN